MVLSIGLIQHFQVDVPIRRDLTVSVKAVATFVLIEAINVVCQSRRCHNGKSGKHCADAQNVVRCLSPKEELGSDDIADS